MQTIKVAQILKKSFEILIRIIQISFSESEIIYIRLCGLSCLLKLICNPYFYSRMKPDDFLIIITLLRVS